jgi:two-component system, chemotaxis family, chemotaxis protein CheY
MPVLVIERRQDLVTLIEGMLRRLHFKNVESTSDGDNGLQVLQRGGPSIIIADLHMEAMPGLEMLRAIRLDQRLRRCPFLITAETLTPFEARALKNAGVDGLLLKPFRPDVLMPKLEVAVQRNATSRAISQLTHVKRTPSTLLGRRVLYRANS